MYKQYKAVVGRNLTSNPEKLEFPSSKKVIYIFIICGITVLNALEHLAK